MEVGGGPESLALGTQALGAFSRAVILASELKSLLNVLQPALAQD